MDTKDLKIAVAGTGYVGLSIATLLSQHHQVMVAGVPGFTRMNKNRRWTLIRSSWIPYFSQYDYDNNSIGFAQGTSTVCSIIDQSWLRRDCQQDIVLTPHLRLWIWTYSGRVESYGGQLHLVFRRHRFKSRSLAQFCCRAQQPLSQAPVVLPCSWRLHHRWDPLEDIQFLLWDATVAGEDFETLVNLENESLAKVVSQIYDYLAELFEDPLINNDLSGFFHEARFTDNFYEVRQVLKWCFFDCYLTSGRFMILPSKKSVITNWSCAKATGR